MSTPRTDALCARLQPTLSMDNFGEVAMQCIAESLVLCTALDCGEACGMDGAYPDAWEQMKAAAK